MKNEKLSSVLDRLRALHHETFQIIKSTKVDDNLEDLSDACFTLREIAKLADDLRKEAQTRKGVLERTACLIWSVMAEPPEKINAQQCTAIPHVKNVTAVPKPGTPEYATLMSHFGVNQQFLESGLVRIHWPEWANYCDTLASEGRNLPIAFDKTYPVYTLSLYAKRNSG